jgi:hypothetical protein
MLRVSTTAEAAFTLSLPCFIVTREMCNACRAAQRDEQQALPQCRHRFPEAAAAAATANKTLHVDSLLEVQKGQRGVCMPKKLQPNLGQGQGARRVLE